MDNCVDVSDNSSYTFFVRLVNSPKHYFLNSYSLILLYSVIPFNSHTSWLLSDSQSSWIRFSMIKTGLGATDGRVFALLFNQSIEQLLHFNSAFHPVYSDSNAFFTIIFFFPSSNREV